MPSPGEKAEESGAREPVNYVSRETLEGQESETDGSVGPDAVWNKSCQHQVPTRNSSCTLTGRLLDKTDPKRTGTSIKETSDHCS